MKPLPWGRRYLVCEPRGFTVAYAINPYMDVSKPPDAARARSQWDALVAELARAGATTSAAIAADGVPDMAFAMNAGFVMGGVAVPSRFRYPERQREEPHWRRWFEESRFTVRDLDVAPEVRFEGGDVFLAGGALVGGFGFRSDRVAIEALGRTLGVPAIPVELVDPRYYHLDVVFCPLDARRALVYEPALSTASRARVREAVPDPVLLEDEEAAAWSANSVVVGDVILMPACSPRLRRVLEDEVGLRVVLVDVSEFHKAGGSVRCLTMPLDLP